MYLPVDRLAHLMYEPGTAVHRRLVREVGRGVLGPRGEVDRGLLGARVFGRPAEMARLERAVHPALGAAARAALARMRARWPLTAVEAGPLLFRLGLAKSCDFIVLTTCARRIQVSRLARSRGITRAEAARRVSAVASHEAAARRLARSRGPGAAMVADTCGNALRRRTARRARRHRTGRRSPHISRPLSSPLF